MRLARRMKVSQRGAKLPVRLVATGSRGRLPEAFNGWKIRPVLTGAARAASLFSAGMDPTLSGRLWDAGQPGQRLKMLRQAPESSGVSIPEHAACLRHTGLGRPGTSGRKAPSAPSRCLPRSRPIDPKNSFMRAGSSPTPWLAGRG
jgi:hypothetical protein